MIAALVYALAALFVVRRDARATLKRNAERLLVEARAGEQAAISRISESIRAAVARGAPIQQSKSANQSYRSLVATQRAQRRGSLKHIAKVFDGSQEK